MDIEMASRTIPEGAFRIARNPPRKATPRTRLVAGPTMATLSSCLGSFGISSIWETPPKMKMVMPETL